MTDEAIYNNFFKYLEEGKVESAQNVIDNIVDPVIKAICLSELSNKLHDLELVARSDEKLIEAYGYIDIASQQKSLINEEFLDELMFIDISDVVVFNQLITLIKLHSNAYWKLRLFDNLTSAVPFMLTVNSEGPEEDNSLGLQDYRSVMTHGFIGDYKQWIIEVQNSDDIHNDGVSIFISNAITFFNCLGMGETAEDVLDTITLDWLYENVKDELDKK
jgi:hypothetical protein